MCRILILVAILFCSSSMYAQKIHFSDTTNQWTLMKYSLIRGHTQNIYSIRQWYDGDSAINGTKYQKLYQRMGSDSQIYIKLIREDVNAGKVFQLSDTAETIYMDYQWKKGDSVKFNSMYEPDRMVSIIDTMSIGNDQYRMFYLNGSYLTDIYVEGLGHIGQYTLGSGINPHCFSNQNIRPYTDKLFPHNNQGSCSDSALVINEHKLEDYKVLVFPQPANEFVNITLPYEFISGKIELMDFTGNIIYQHTFQDKQKLEILGGFVQGLKIYRITDNTSGNIFTGRLLMGN